MPVGLESISSAAKVGPDKYTVGCLRPRMEGITSDSTWPDTTSRPLLTEIRGSDDGSSGCGWGFWRSCSEWGAAECGVCNGSRET